MPPQVQENFTDPDNNVGSKLNIELVKELLAKRKLRLNRTNYIAGDGHCYLSARIYAVLKYIQDGFLNPDCLDPLITSLNQVIQSNQFKSEDDKNLLTKFHAYLMNFRKNSKTQIDSYLIFQDRNSPSLGKAFKLLSYYLMRDNNNYYNYYFNPTATAVDDINRIDNNFQNLNIFISVNPKITTKSTKDVILNALYNICSIGHFTETINGVSLYVLGKCFPNIPLGTISNLQAGHEEALISPLNAEELDYHQELQKFNELKQIKETLNQQLTSLNDANNFNLKDIGASQRSTQFNNIKTNYVNFISRLKEYKAELDDQVFNNYLEEISKTIKKIRENVQKCMSPEFNKQLNFLPDLLDKETANFENLYILTIAQPVMPEPEEELAQNQPPTTQIRQHLEVVEQDPSQNPLKATSCTVPEETPIKQIVYGKLVVSVQAEIKPKIPEIKTLNDTKSDTIQTQTLPETREKKTAKTIQNSQEVAQELPQVAPEIHRVPKQMSSQTVECLTAVISEATVIPSQPLKPSNYQMIDVVSKPKDPEIQKFRAELILVIAQFTKNLYFNLIENPNISLEPKDKESLLLAISSFIDLNAYLTNSKYEKNKLSSKKLNEICLSLLNCPHFNALLAKSENIQDFLNKNPKFKEQIQNLQKAKNHNVLPKKKCRFLDNLKTPTTTQRQALSH